MQGQKEAKMKDLIPREIVENKIYLIRGHKVMLSQHLAKLYNVETRILVQAVKRNMERFPEDFMFQLTLEEAQSLRSQFEISNVPLRPTASGRGGSRYLPYAFTEQGVAMLSGILHSPRAVQVNIAIMRAFVKLREILSNNKELAYKLKELESKVEKHDIKIHAIFEAIRQLMVPPEKAPKRIGFRAE